PPGLSGVVYREHLEDASDTRDVSMRSCAVDGNDSSPSEQPGGQPISEVGHAVEPVGPRNPGLGVHPEVDNCSPQSTNLPSTATQGCIEAEEWKAFAHLSASLPPVPLGVPPACQRYRGPPHE